MALDKLVDSSQLNSNLTSVANAIRSKSGQTGSLSFPTGMVSAIAAIQTGGGGSAPQLQAKTATPSLSQQVISPDSGKDGLSSVTVAAITKALLQSLDADFVAGNIRKGKDLFGLVGSYEGSGSGGGGGQSITPVRITEDSHQYVTIYVDIAEDGTLTPSGAGKNGGQFYNPEIEPAVADFSGNQTVTVYWGGSASTYRSDSKQVTLTYDVVGGSSGAGVTVESLSVTENGTYTAPSGKAYSPVTVNVPSSSGKAAQACDNMARVASTSLTATTVTLTVEKTGTYTVRWFGYRSSTSGTNGSQLYIGNTAYGTENTSFTVNSNGQTNKLTGVQLTAGQTITVRARSRGTQYYMFVMGLSITEE